MIDTPTYLRHKIKGAEDLQSVVRTMKAVAASSIGQYEKSVSALAEYLRTVELGLGACLRSQRHLHGPSIVKSSKVKPSMVLVVFGSDQGLVGRFNERIVDLALKNLPPSQFKKSIWAVGERVQGRLRDLGLTVNGLFTVPRSVNSIETLVGQILQEVEDEFDQENSELHLIYNKPQSEGSYTSVTERLLPLDNDWRKQRIEMSWPTQNLPEVMGRGMDTLETLIREYLFVSLFRASAESLASENASRLSAMQRAERNIENLLQDSRQRFHKLRQQVIDEELFDVISGFEALAAENSNS